jgi:hypothetical protein
MAKHHLKQSTMTTMNVFTSAQDIRAWFATRIAPLEAQARTLSHCSNCHPLVDPCSACVRKHDIIDKDLATWKTLETSELHLFNYPAESPSEPEFQKLYIQRMRKIQKDNDRLREDKDTVSHQNMDARGETTEARRQENDGQGKDTGGVVTMVDLVEQLEDLDRWFDMCDEVMKAKGWI